MGRGRSGARAVQPAATAPEVTTTTRRPSARAPATSPLSLSMASPSTRPEPVVTEDEPILTTTVRPVVDPDLKVPPLTTAVAVRAGHR